MLSIPSALRLRPRPRAVERRRSVDYPSGDGFVLLISLAFTLISARFYLNPQALAVTRVGRELPPGWDDVYCAMFLIGGLGVVVGILAQLRVMEMVASILVAAAALCNAVAIQGAYTGGSYSAAIFAVAALAYLARARRLYLYVLRHYRPGERA